MFLQTWRVTLEQKQTRVLTKRKKKKSMESLNCWLRTSSDCPMPRVPPLPARLFLAGSQHDYSCYRASKQKSPILTYANPPLPPRYLQTPPGQSFQADFPPESQCVSQARSTLYCSATRGEPLRFCGLKAGHLATPSHHAHY